MSMLFVSFYTLVTVSYAKRIKELEMKIEQDSKQKATKNNQQRNPNGVASDAAGAVNTSTGVQSYQLSFSKNPSKIIDVVFFSLFTLLFKLTKAQTLTLLERKFIFICLT
jgi:hypothetical protein